MEKRALNYYTNAADGLGEFDKLFAANATDTLTYLTWLSQMPDGTAVQDDEEYLSRVGGMVKGIVDIPFICGFCYTQVSNVYHEVNGLLEFDRTPKESFEKYRKVFDLTLPE